MTETPMSPRGAHAQMEQTHALDQWVMTTRLADAGLTIEQQIQAEIGQQAADQVSIKLPKSNAAARAARASSSHAACTYRGHAHAPYGHRSPQSAAAAISSASN